MRVSHGLLIAFLLTACGGDDDGGTGPNVERIDGPAWGLEAEYGNEQQGLACALEGTLTLTQSGDDLTGGQIVGRQVCVGPDGSSDVNISQPITSGGITSAGGVTFNTTAQGITCAFAGEFAEDEVGQAIEGTVECSTATPLSGFFSAQR
jgi:hypothetical protein